MPVTIGNITPTGTINNTRTPILTADFSTHLGNVMVRIWRVTSLPDPGSFNPVTDAATHVPAYEWVRNSGIIFVDTPMRVSHTVTSRLSDDVYRVYWITADWGSTEWSSWEHADFTLSDPLLSPTPGSQRPPHGTITAETSLLLESQVPAHPSGRRAGILFELSNDNFASHSIVYPADVLAAGPWTRQLQTQPLSAGIWYLRSRTSDEFGQVSDWHATSVVIITGKPQTKSHSPNDTVVPYEGGNVVLSWVLDDPNPTNTITSATVEVIHPPTMFYIVQEIDFYTTENRITVSIPQSYNEQELAWRVQVKDNEGLWSDISPWVPFRVANKPEVNIQVPDESGLVWSPKPTFHWSITSPFVVAGPDFSERTQKQWRVYVTDESGESEIVADSGWQAGEATSWEMPTAILTTDSQYLLTIEVIDNLGLSARAMRPFIATYTRPTPVTPVLDAGRFQEEAAIIVDWSAAVIDVGFVEWRVYRSSLESEFEIYDLIFSTNSPSVRSFVDYLMPCGESHFYVVVQAVVNAFSQVVESIFQPAQIPSLYTPYFFLIVPDEPSLNLQLRNVKSDSFGDEQEMETINLIGRGRRVEYGTRYGQSGSLEVQLYDRPGLTARQQRRAIETIRDSKLPVYLRNPFGDVWKVALMSAQVSRIAGVGPREYATVNIEYVEVTA